MRCEACDGCGYNVAVENPTDMDECGYCHGSGFATPPLTMEVSVQYMGPDGIAFLGTLDLDTMVVTPLFPVDDVPDVAAQQEVLAEMASYSEDY